MKEQEDYSKLVQVYAGTMWEAELVKGLLESDDIISSIKDGLMTAIAPNISPTVSVWVNESDYDAAVKIIKDRDNKDE